MKIDLPTIKAIKVIRNADLVLKLINKYYERNK